MEHEQNLIQELDTFLRNNPPKPRPTKEEIENMVLENIEILLDIKREQAKKKNKNIESSNQYNLLSKFERNLIRLCRVAPKVLCDPQTAKANRNTLNRFIRKKR